MTRNGDLENIDSFKVTIGDNLKTVGDIDKSSMREQKNERYRQDNAGADIGRVPLPVG